MVLDGLVDRLCQGNDTFLHDLQLDRVDNLLVLEWVREGHVVLVGADLHVPAAGPENTDLGVVRDKLHDVEVVLPQDLVALACIDAQRADAVRVCHVLLGHLLRVPPHAGVAAEFDVLVEMRSPEAHRSRRCPLEIEQI